MPVTQYDSTTAADIPVDAPAVAGYDPSHIPYLDVGIAWAPTDWDRFATPHKLHIARFAFMDGDCLDVETGDATPIQSPTWARKRITAGLARPWVYVNLSNWDATKAFCAGLPVRWWVANPTGIPHIVPGSDMTQYAFSDTSGGHYDLSLAADGVLDGGKPVTWDGSYPMPDPPPAGTTVEVVVSGTIKLLDGAGQPPHWFSSPDGADQGTAPVGAGVTSSHGAFDGVNWWLQIAPGVWWLLASAVDSGGVTPVSAWNEAHKPPPPAPTGPTMDQFNALKAAFEGHKHDTGAQHQ